MTVSAHEFMNTQHKSGKQSRLDPFKEEILLLKSNGYTLEQIMTFLAQNDVTISKTALHHFIKTRMTTKNKPPIFPEQSIKELPSAAQAEADHNQNTQIQPGKFNWQADVKDSDIF